jgi:uncharacterized membrane protein YgdD (TMEM256/DUF423 family)
MNKTPQRWLFNAAVIGALATIFGAFGAHAVPGYLESRAFDAASTTERLEDFETAARYHMYGALFLLGVAIVMHQAATRALSVAAWCMLLGMAVFCGAVYAVALVPEELRGTFGMLAPIGGTLMIAAWVALAVAACNRK